MDLARRVCSRDLKMAAMREIDAGRTISEVARQLELSPKLLERWRGEWRARGELAFPGVGRRGAGPALSELQRVAELERKIGQLTMENDFLNNHRLSVGGLGFGDLRGVCWDPGGRESGSKELGRGVQDGGGEGRCEFLAGSMLGAFWAHTAESLGLQGVAPKLLAQALQQVLSADARLQSAAAPLRRRYGVGHGAVSEGFAGR
jgi:transposase